jgi:hypothetical protein
MKGIMPEERDHAERAVSFFVEGDVWLFLLEEAERAAIKNM